MPLRLYYHNNIDTDTHYSCKYVIFYCILNHITIIINNYYDYYDVVVHNLTIKLDQTKTKLYGECQSNTTLLKN